MSITLFENITAKLTDHEKNILVPMLIDTLRYKHTDDRVKGKHLSGWFRACGENVSEARIRKMINYIRVMNLVKPKVVIGASNGYYLTDDMHVVDDEIESLEGRIDSMNCVVDSLKAQRENLRRRI